MTALLYAARGGFGTTSDLYTLDPLTGVETSIGPIGFGVTGLAFDPTDSTLYGSTSTNSAANPKSLITIDPVTGAGTLVAAFGGGAGVAIPDLAFDGTGQLWGWRQASNKLTAINKATGGLTDLGASGLSTFGGGTSFDSGDVCYTFQNGSLGNYYTVNTVTGATTLVGALVPGVGITSGALNAAAFDSVDLLWAIVKAFKLVTINVATGDETLIGNMAGDETWDALAWSVSAPPPPAIVGRVLIALDDGPLEADPVWTRIDDTPNLVSGIDIRRGKQSETDQTETSTATVYLNDTAGLFDMHNVSSPYWGKLVGHQILLQLLNPVTDVWEPQTRMTIDDLTHDFNPAINAAGEPLLANVAIECVDLFDYLAGVEMIPGLFGDTPPAGSARTVFYEDTTGGDGMQTRLVQLATNAGIPGGRTRFFTGNVDLQETKYDPGESLLVAMRDAVEAEFPDIANLYTDRRGILAAHGRFARFTPAAVASGTDWVFTTWKAGDGVAIALDSDRAQIRPPLQWGRPRSRIVNAAMCTPKGIVDADVPGQIVSDSTSITAYGYRSWSALELIVKAGATTGFTAKGECRSFAKFKVDNLKDPHTRVEAITFKSLRPGDPRAAKTWDLLCAVDISDVIELTHGYPGGVGMVDEPFYVEGMETQIRPLNPDFDWIEKTVNVSPASVYPPAYVFSDA